MEGKPFHTTSVMTLKLPPIAAMSRLWPHFFSETAADERVKTSFIT
jgi:hypothetical protein